MSPPAGPTSYIPPMRTPALAVLALSLVACAAQPPPAQSQDGVRGLDLTLRRLTERVNRSVVRVQAVGYAPVPGPASTATSLLARQRQTGSGVVVARGGIVATNFHVVAGASRIWVEVPAPAEARAARRSVLGAPYERVDAELLGADRETDVAVLRIDRDLTPLPFGDSEDIATGQLVVAFGSPLGLEGSVTMGVVSAAARQLQPDAPLIYVQTDAAINPGSSGGPLVDLRGNIIGLNTLIVSRGGGSDGIGLAIPANIVETVVQNIREDGRVRRGVLGIGVQTITPGLAEALELPRSWGVVVSDVDPRGPAAAAGVEVGDVVAELDGRPMENARQFNVNIYQRSVGVRVTLAILRGRDRVTFEVPVVERLDPPVSSDQLADPRRQTLERIGVVGVDVTEAFARRLGLRRPEGILVVAGASSHGFQPGDVIHSVGTTVVQTFVELREALEAIPEGQGIVLQVERRGRLRFLELEE
jgi:serine protease Do